MGSTCASGAASQCWARGYSQTRKLELPAPYGATRVDAWPYSYSGSEATGLVSLLDNAGGQLRQNHLCGSWEAVLYGISTCCQERSRLPGCHRECRKAVGDLHFRVQGIAEALDEQAFGVQ